MVAAERPRYSYQVDAQDRLAWLSPNWLAFARENGAAQLTEEAVLGQSLWSYIADDRTRRLYQSLMSQIRLRGSRVVVPFRCDSPRMRRYMRLSIATCGEGQLQFEGTLVKTESREYVAVVDVTTSRSDQLVTLCSICLRALIESIGWIDIEDAIGQMRLLEGDTYPQLRYSVCPTCAMSPVTLPA